MLLYNCILTGSTVFTDSYKIEFLEDACAYKISSKVVNEKGETISDSMIGGNASQEEACEEYSDPDVKSGLDLVLAYRYSGPFLSGSQLVDFFKVLVKELRGKQRCDEDEYKAGAEKFFKFLKKSLKQEGCGYTPENADDSPIHCCPICIWYPDGSGADFYYFKHALFEEAC